MLDVEGNNLLSVFLMLKIIMLVFIELFWNSISNKHLFEKSIYVFYFVGDQFAQPFYRIKYLRQAYLQEISSNKRNCI